MSKSKFYLIISLVILTSIFLFYKLVTFKNNSPFELDDPKDLVLNEYREGYKLIKDTNYGVSFQYPEDYKIEPISQTSLKIYKSETSFVYISKVNYVTSEELPAVGQMQLEDPSLDKDLPFPTVSPEPVKLIEKIFQKDNRIYNVKGSYTFEEKTQAEIEEIIQSFEVI